MAVMVLGMAEDASAELLLETGGIELHSTARVVTYEASLCNVLEASHTEAEYERIKASHGQPLDVCQLDFSVDNGSGRWLDHLIARYGIESKWPDCTNWSGDGPGGGPSGTYSEPVQRAGELRVFDGMEFVWVPAGEFRMASTSPDALSWRKQPVTQVRISRGFDLGKYEVTQGQWEAVMGSNPSFYDACGLDCPVEQVTWEDAQEFIWRLNGRSGGNRYRLPTEAEWEYAARAGTTGDRYGDVDAIAWYRGNNSKFGEKPVGQKAPNAEIGFMARLMALVSLPRCYENYRPAHVIGGLHQ